ncbi:MAG TPA: xanthine dehydrogenase small subunit, partial [Hellea balneolensis]|nr:xanthine dehydrogenase small subunit [Hellea balneolensis]
MRDTIRFLYNGEVITEHHLDPTMNVLEYLRTRLGQTGTKEGCAEGDCGACTVVLGELEDGTLRYRAINACIVFVPVLDGKELITTESLGTPDAPHPIQKALAENHGSQCGFCTPGFVMSLYALGQSDQPPTRENVNEALAGNLCRCTGYGPIIDTAMTMAPTRATHKHIDTLKALQSDETVHLRANIHGDEKQIFIPKTEAELARLLSECPDAVLLAGGTDIGLWVNKQHRVLPTVIYLGQISSLNKIRKTDTHIRIGAGVKYSDALPLLGQFYPDMDTVMRRIGSTQIRNLGTIGGNIANGSPIGDMPPLLIAAGAELTLASLQGQRTLALEDYFIDYGQQDLRTGEYVQSITIPKPGAQQEFFAYKISKRFEQDISAVCMAMSFDLVDGICENVRIAFGGMAATPKRASTTEQAL